MSIFEKIQIFGLLDPNQESATRIDALEAWLELANSPDTGSDEGIYRYTLRREGGDDIERRTAEAPETIIEEYNDYHFVASELFYDELLIGYTINEGRDNFPPLPHYKFSINPDEFDPRYSSRAEIDGRVETVIELALELNTRIDPLYSFGTAQSEGRPFPTHDEITEQDIDGSLIHWLNIIPPELVETIGRERLHSAPAWRGADQEDGSVLLVVHRTPLRPRSRQAGRRDRPPRTGVVTVDPDGFHIGLKTPNMSTDAFRTLVEA